MISRPPFVQDLRQIADNLVLSDGGLWVCPGHRDFKFLETDATDWAGLELRSFWYRHRNRCFLALTERFPPAGVLFEIGAGNGSVSLALQNAGYPVVAVEPTAKLACRALHRGVRHVVCSTLEGAKFRAGSISNAGLFDVLEHIPDDEAFLTTLRRLMPVGGRLYCAVPAWQLLWSREDEYAGHVRRYAPAGFRRKIERAGFEIEHETGYFAALTLPIFLRRALPSWLGLRGQRTSASSEQEHQPSFEFVARVLRGILDREIVKISAGEKRRLGASLFVVARAV
ncbi:MAG: hypothetical protein A2V88_07090 [Elusimicrobia bacterium RBG_16_66_12]|nr:MAG: hypothetical protein A2V88_07090 [Elusimicrobia bacterium RBG_16_66_12]